MWLTEFLGILGLERTAKARHEETIERMRAYADTNNERWLIVQQSLARIEQQLQVQHIPRKPSNPAEYDWEQVQAMELAEMLANPPKENN
jgi:hypothetical protein